MALFVEDMFIIGHRLPNINILKNLVSSRFKMKDLGAAHLLLGMEIRRLAGGDVLLVQ